LKFGSSTHLKKVRQAHSIGCAGMFSEVSRLSILEHLLHTS